MMKGDSSHLPDREPASRLDFGALATAVLVGTAHARTVDAISWRNNSS